MQLFPRLRIGLAALAAVAVGLVAFGLSRLGPIVRLRAIYASENDSYYSLLDKARSLFDSRTWVKSSGGETLAIVGCSTQEAFGPIRIKGLRPKLIERLYMPLLTDRPDPLYMVVVTSQSPADGTPVVDWPPGRTVEHLSIWGNDYLISPPARMLSPSREMPATSAHWRAVRILASESPGRGAKFDPPPDYQVDVYNDAVWEGVFAAWSNPKLDHATWQPTDANGGFLGPPAGFEPKPLTIAAAAGDRAGE